MTDVTERVSKLEAITESHADNIRQLREATMNLDNDIKELRAELGIKIDGVNHSLSKVVTGALNSMPEWAAREVIAREKSATVARSIALSMVTVVLTLLGWILFKH